MGTTERSVFEVCPDDPSVTLIRKEVWIESDFLGLRRHTIQQLQKITRWYSSNGPAARLLRWSVLVLRLVTYGPRVKLVKSVTCIHVHMSKYQHNTILVTFPTEVTISGNSLSLESYFYHEDTFTGK